MREIVISDGMKLLSLSCVGKEISWCLASCWEMSVTLMMVRNTSVFGNFSVSHVMVGNICLSCDGGKHLSVL